MPSPDSAIEAVLEYHGRTKHHLHRYAASPGYLDWVTQPNPFRTFDGADRVELPLLADQPTTGCSDLYRPGAAPLVPLSREGVAILFELSLGLSAWKEYRGNRWALRCNPSSGNLHPTEGYAILPAMPDLAAGVYHYDSREHALERRCALHGEAARQLVAALPSESCLVGLSSIHWREAWKYGERAFRYCQHDIGHAIAAVRYAAAALGWPARVVADAPDSTIAAVLGLVHPDSFSRVAEQDREHPAVLLLIGPCDGSGREAKAARPDLSALQAALDAGVWTGQANVLSPAHVPWPAIDVAAEATWREESAGTTQHNGAVTSAGQAALWPPPLAGPAQIGAVRLIKQRRSAQAFDGVTAMEATRFYAMLDRLLPRPGVPPWDVWPWPAHLHCTIFVHRVQGVSPGLYLLERNPAIHERLRAALRPDFAWTRPESCPASLPLFVLAAGDFQELAQAVSCHQEIAGDSAFSLGMIADFADSIRTAGAWWYRRLFWEAGLLGQVLYLEAEAAGLRGTGIGCFFDDAVHDLLGLTGERFQSLYHFTVGGPVDDPRLTTLPPYFHLDATRRGGDRA
jgi:SagB-type dehydrogenase family enzyme